MNTLQLDEPWLQQLLPDGFSYPSSTLISGPGGTGKPLVEYAFVSSWLKAGGSVISVPLQYPTMDFVKNAMHDLYHIDLDKYGNHVAFIQFDPSIDGYEKVDDQRMKANLLKPDIWTKAVEEANKQVAKSEIGTMVFGSALNLLLFSPTYKEAVVEYIKDMIQNDALTTYIFSVSTTAFADKIKIWEDVADNLLFTRMDKEKRLFINISRMKGVRYSEEEVHVPISKEELMRIKQIAEATRKKIIPQIRKI